MSFLGFWASHFENSDSTTFWIYSPSNVLLGHHHWRADVSVKMHGSNYRKTSPRGIGQTINDKMPLGINLERANVNCKRHRNFFFPNTVLAVWCSGSLGGRLCNSHQLEHTLKGNQHCQRSLGATLFFPIWISVSPKWVLILDVFTPWVETLWKMILGGHANVPVTYIRSL